MLQAFTGLGSAAKPPTPETARELTRVVANYWEKQAALWTRSLAAARRRQGSAARGRRRTRRPALPRRAVAQPPLVQPAQADLPAELPLARTTWSKPPTWTPREKHKLRFFSRQFIDSMSPANFATTNPDVINGALESKGESVQAGLANLMEDMRRGRISITDETAFEVGTQRGGLRGLGGVRERAVPADPVRAADRQGGARGRCSSCRLASTSSTSSTCSPKTRSCAIACEQGMTVFLVSWRNPDASLGHMTWDDYLEQGAMKAIEVAHGDQRRRQGERAGLVRRRHHPLVGARGAARARRQDGGEPDPADDHARLRGAGRPGRLHRRSRACCNASRRSARAASIRAPSSASCSRRCAPTT